MRVQDSRAVQLACDIDRPISREWDLAFVLLINAATVLRDTLLLFGLVVGSDHSLSEDVQQKFKLQFTSSGLPVVRLKLFNFIVRSKAG